MGWCESPPFFCAASETARDVVDTLLQEISLPTHPYEDKILSKATAKAVDRLTATASFINLTEVFVDDFIGCTNNASFAHLQHFSRAMMLYGVHSIFPPPEVTGHQGQDPISQKKLEQGEGTWEHTKEILGWLVDGAKFTVQLQPDKCTKISKLLKKVCQLKFCPLQKFQELEGKLQHASFSIPGGKGLFSPINRAMKTTKPHIKMTDHLKATLRDWRTLVQQLGTHPTPVQLLVSEFPNYIQYTDACKLGAGGVITPGLDPIQCWVWQFPWPQDIQDRLVSEGDPTGDLTINDIELAGLVLGWLVLEHVCPDLVFKHIGMFCDNTSAVSWAFKGSTATSIPAGRLLRLLFIRQRVRKASSLVPLHIAGKDNAMADIPSRAFKTGEFFHAKQNLTTYLNTHFSLPQNRSWTEYKVQTKLALHVISCLRGDEPLLMESLHKLPGLGKSTGKSGQNTATNALQTSISQTAPSVRSPSSSPALQPGYGPGLMVEEIKSKFSRSRMRSRPSPIPQNWLDNQEVPSTKQRENTLFPSSA